MVNLLKPLQFKEIFDSIFKERLKVSESIVLETYFNPTKKQQLENSITLYLKEFCDAHLSHLLIASQNINNEEIFVFAYWIPKQFIRFDIALVDLLEVFANSFGCKIKISDKEGYFFRKTRKLIQGRLESPNQIMEILGSVHIPCEYYLFSKENVGYNMNWIDCYCCFAINNNKYLTWLYKIETTSIKVKSEWYSYLSEIRDILNPYGKTGLTILSTKRDKSEGIISHREEKELLNKEVELEIPMSYLKPFARIKDTVSGLQANEKIAVIPKFENNKCIFCGSDNTNREHIFAIWMKNYFEEKTFRSTLHTRSPEEDLLDSMNSGLSTNPESSYGYTTHQVCVECNGTWMSQLEQKAKNILTLYSGTLKTTIISLNLNEANSTQLALWITLKAILLSIKSNIIPIIPLTALENIKKGLMPKDFLVEIGECEFYDLDFIVNKGANALGSLLRLKKIDKEVATELTKDFFMVTIQIGHFLFRISYIDESKGLKREGCIRPTTVLFPFGYNLPYFKLEDEQEEWDTFENNFKLHIFSIGLSLIDY